MILQSDPGWLPARRGCLTGSRMADALAYLKNGKEAEARRKYKIELVAERVSDHAVSRYVTPAMQRGLDLEPDAKDAYEIETGFLLGPAAWFEHPRLDYFGATTDGSIGDDGLAEFKVPLVHNYVEWRLAREIPADHLPQLLAQLAVTRRRYVDFVAFCPEAPPSKRLFIRRLEPTAEDIANLEAGAAAFLAEVDKMFRAFTEAAA